ncbi:MAG: F0F1 ATP synthase subunit B [Nitrospiraceae bacterium]|nr:MAG: ATP synthase F0 subunit B [bacterium]UCF87370.1 MAG: F0F1 ATP synthase subunit B [Nitrospiraceae bacterium]
MLEIELKWFLVQLVNFILLIFLLNRFLFRPFLRLFQERKERTSGYLDEAKNMDKESDDLLHRIEEKLSEAHQKASGIFETLSKDGLSVQKNSIHAATEEAMEINRQAKDDIEAEVRKTKETLRSEVESFSKIIVEKMIGA